MNTGMYRVYDTEEKRWITNECMLDSNGTLYKVIHKNFGRPKLETIHTSLSSDVGNRDTRYVVQRAIYLTDRSKDMIYEGDILRSKDGITGLVSFANQKAAYVLLDMKSYKFYPLGDTICEQLKIVGNEIDDPDLLKM